MDPLMAPLLLVRSESTFQKTWSMIRKQGWYRKGHLYVVSGSKDQKVCECLCLGIISSLFLDNNHRVAMKN